jgi:hypothetical protein
MCAYSFFFKKKVTMMINEIVICKTAQMFMEFTFFFLKKRDEMGIKFKVKWRAARPRTFHRVY